MKKMLITILVVFVLVSFNIQLVNGFINDINMSSGGVIKIQRINISNNKAFKSNVRALNAFVRGLKVNDRDNAAKVNLEVVQALFIQRFNIMSAVMLILVLSSFIVLPKVIKD